MPWAKSTVAATPYSPVLRGRRPSICHLSWRHPQPPPLPTWSLVSVDFVGSLHRRAKWRVGDPAGRNARSQLADEATEVRPVLHDRDRKFSRGFDTNREAEGARVMPTPLMAPKNQHLRRALGG
jgi:hypothetical protein